jgi:heptosyltransferase-2
MNNILIIQTASIGDVILATNLLENLHRQYPNAKIDFLLKNGNQPLFEGHPFLNEVLIWDKSKNKYKNFRRLLFAIRKKRYDLIINVQRFLSTGILTAFSKAKTTAGFKKNPCSFLFTHSFSHSIGDNTHEIDRNLSLISKWLHNPQRIVKLYPTAKDIDFTAKYKLSPYISISPASLWFTKQLPAEKWAELIAKIPNNLTVYLLGGKNDKTLCEEIAKNARNDKVQILAGGLTLLQSAALMRDAQMNFVNDSAPLHLCSAVNAATTAVFCSTVPQFGFAPLSDNALVVECREDLACRPCGLHGHNACPQTHFKCGYGIDTGELAAF